jgi:hypothetical protein
VTGDPLAPLMDLAGVPAALAAARDRVDAALRHRVLRRSAGRVAAEVALRTAVASAALDGHEYDLAQVRGGTVADPVVQGALRVNAGLPGLVATWAAAPRQALARLHVLAARDIVPDAALGRPVARPETVARLDALLSVLAQPATPALLRAAVVHGELLAAGPFPGPNALVARAAARLSLMSAGLDPRGLLGVDVGHLARRPEYVGSAGAFATGTPDGLRSWLRHYASAVEAAAAELVSVCDELSA